MFDMRVAGTNFCQWDEEFVINEEAEYIFQSNVIIMFEILTFNVGLIKEKSALLRPDNLYPVAWAYLRPLGAGGVHGDKVKLQLYKFKYAPDASAKFGGNIDPRSPFVVREL